MKISPVLLTALLASVALASGGGTAIKLTANLAGAGKGKAAWKTKDSGNQHEAELEVSGDRLRRNTPYAVSIGNNGSFMVKTDALGAFHAVASYRTLNRPDISAGTPIAVSDAASTIVLAGTFN